MKTKNRNKNNIAMFIDCDNVSSKYIKSIFNYLSQTLDLFDMEYVGDRKTQLMIRIKDKQ